MFLQIESKVDGALSHQFNFSYNQLWKQHVAYRDMFWCTEMKSANLSARHFFKKLL